MVARPLVLDRVVDQDLCIGCGICTDQCPTQALTMIWNPDGFLVPKQIGACGAEGDCLRVCPFNPDEKDPERNEDGLSRRFLKDASQSDLKLGRYIGLHAGFASGHRMNSSSGGIATYVFEKLLERKLVEHVVSVGQAKSGDNHYEYIVTSNVSDLKAAAKTKYYPVSLGEVITRVRDLPGRVAVSGVACFVKALRLAQSNDALLHEKIRFVVGIICGGVKSRHYTDYLAAKSGADITKVSLPRYRVKNESSDAADYTFSCIDLRKGEEKSVRMQTIGDMWGTGLFKANACDYCDDVMTELADISLGDAWIKPFDRDGRGNSVIVTRSPEAEGLMCDGSRTNELQLVPLSRDMMVASQQGSFNHRHDGLYVRIRLRLMQRRATPAKRYWGMILWPDVWMVQYLRSVSRRRSLAEWVAYEDCNEFDRAMRSTLINLKFATRILNYRRSLIRKVKEWFR